VALRYGSAFSSPENPQFSGEAPSEPCLVRCNCLLGVRLLQAKMPLQVESTMKDAEDVDILAVQIGDSVLSVKQDANTWVATRIVEVPHLRKLEQQVSPLEDPAYHLVRCLRPLAADVLVDLPQPPSCFGRPDQPFRQDSIDRSISSSEIVRPASTSASPRSTMRLKTSSLTMSSYELSSGRSWTIATTTSFALRPGFGMTHSIPTGGRPASPLRTAKRDAAERHAEVRLTLSLPREYPEYPERDSRPKDATTRSVDRPPSQFADLKDSRALVMGSHPRQYFAGYSDRRRERIDSAYSYASTAGHAQIKFRSPYVLSIRPTNGQNLCARTQGAGNAASWRL
jgi:hypothetical protein